MPAYSGLARVMNRLPMRWNPPPLGMTVRLTFPERTGSLSATASTNALASHGAQQLTPATGTARAAMRWMN